MSVKYYPIDEDAARLAKEMNSFSDYVPGGATAAYRQYVDKAVEIAEAQKKRVGPSIMSASTTCWTCMPVNWPRT